MLHLNFGLSFEALAEDLMTKLKEAWTDPFEPPVIIFPDLALEQWFKLKWIAKNRVLANLNTQFLDKFLFNALAGKPQTGERRKERLTSELLQNMILAWLHKEKNWETLDDEVKNYIQRTTSDESNNTSDESNKKLTPDENRLFDFAGKMALLYMEYETSRPGEFKPNQPGLIEKWNELNIDFFSAKKNNKHTREAWQRNLYRKLFVEKDCVLNEINKEVANQGLNFEYITLPQLYAQCRKQNVIFKGASEQPVFLFWHAGLGQFYRVALNAYAKDHDVYAYIQNPCMEFWEDVEDGKPRFKNKLLREGDYDPEKTSDFDILNSDDNQLLAKWGRGGRDNIRLWCESAEYDFEFNPKKDATSMTDTLLHQIQYSVSNLKNNNKDQIQFTKDDSLTVKSAPSKIREVEQLHSDICKLLKDGSNIRDILIVAPQINDYRTAIHQIFASERSQAEEIRQKKRLKKQLDEKDVALYIPYTIIDGEPRESHTARALKTLFRICDSGALNRLDFFELVRNPLVQTVRSIDPDEVSHWEEWLTGMNVYRDRIIISDDKNKDSPYDDWKTGIRRLLLARMTDCRVEVGDDKLQPFADLHTQDDASLCRFIEAVQSLEELCNKRERWQAHGISLEGLINDFIPMLNKWIASNDVPKSYAFEQIIYKNIMDSIEGLKYQYATGLDTIAIECLEQMLVGASVTSSYTVGSLFINGLTFMNFTPNRIIPVRHLFFLGMDAAGYPGRDIQNSLDLRTGDMWPGDNQNAVKNRYAFLCQMMSTSDSLHISYVNKNLQKDEDFFPSSMINDLFTFLSYNNSIPWMPEEIELDEKRKITELFTARAMRNRELYRSMVHSETGKQSQLHDNLEKNPNVDETKLPERVYLSSLSRYLKDPFQFRVNEITQRDDDDIDPERIVYEPIDVDNIELLGIIRDVAQLYIRKDERYTDLYIQKSGTEGKIPDDYRKLTQNEVDDRVQSVMGKFMQSLRESGMRMAPLYEKLLTEKIEADAHNVADQMLEGQLVYADQDNAIDVTIEQELENGSQFKWQLQGTAEWHVWGKDSPSLTITSVAMGKGYRGCYQYLSAFTSALALVVQKARNEHWDEDSDVPVTIYLCFTKGPTDQKEFKVSPEKAKQIIKDIYKYAYVEQFAMAAPMKILEDTTNNKKEIVPKIKSFNELEYDLNDSDHGSWAYFKKGKVFDLRTDIGYDSYNQDKFEDQWKKARTKQLGLIKLLEPKNTTLNPTVENQTDAPKPTESVEAQVPVQDLDKTESVEAQVVVQDTESKPKSRSKKAKTYAPDSDKTESVKAQVAVQDTESKPKSRSKKAKTDAPDSDTPVAEPQPKKRGRPKKTAE